MPKMLIIEDEELLRNLYSELLGMKGFSIETATDGKAALEILNDRRKPDLILLDINMPEMDGIEFLRILKGNDKLKRIPVVLVTGVIQVEKISEGLDLGAVGYIEKANSPIEVISRIEMILNSILKTPVKSNEMQVGPKKMGEEELKSL